ncbi:MAG: hypothetical protein ABUL47_01235, partial [Leifsonia sp.]
MGLPSFLFGFRVHQPREYLRLRRIRTRIYTRVAKLDAEILRSPEPTLFADIDPTGFRKIRPYTAWGKVFDCAWLHITGQVPEGIKDHYVMLGIGGGEGLIYSSTGEVVDSVSAAFQQGDLPHA